MTFIPPFDDYRIIEGQGTVAMEICEDLSHIDYLFVPVGGGGLSAGVGTYLKTFSPQTHIIGLEPEGAVGGRVEAVPQRAAQVRDRQGLAPLGRRAKRAHGA